MSGHIFPVCPEQFSLCPSLYRGGESTAYIKNTFCHNFYGKHFSFNKQPNWEHPDPLQMYYKPSLTHRSVHGVEPTAVRSVPLPTMPCAATGSAAGTARWAALTHCTALIDSFTPTYPPTRLLLCCLHSSLFSCLLLWLFFFFLNSTSWEGRRAVMLLTTVTLLRPARETPAR